MRKTTIGVTEAAQNFAALIDRANTKVCTGSDLAAALEKVDLTEAEAAAWNGDLISARKTLKAPENKWR